MPLRSIARLALGGFLGLSLLLPSPAAATVTRMAAVGAAPLRPGIRIDFVSVSWRGASTEGAIRFRRADRWTRWRVLPLGDAGRRGRVTSALVPAGRSRAVQVRLPRGATDGRAAAIDASPPRYARAQAGSARVMTPAGPICYLSRAAWGADETLRGADPPAYFPVQALTVHHTATVDDDPDPAATVRAIYAQHVVANGFADIGYQLLVDEHGCVYEGRASGEDGLPVFAGLPLPGQPLLAVNGAHAAGFNAGNVGVALLGDFTDRAPTPQALRALVGVLAALSFVTGLDPAGEVAYVNPISGATLTVDAIAGHRDWNPTECPGDRLYELLPDVRARVAGLVAGVAPALSGARADRRTASGRGRA
jgi:hypothetical protein